MAVTFVMVLLLVLLVLVLVVLVLVLYVVLLVMMVVGLFELSVARQRGHGSPHMVASVSYRRSHVETGLLVGNAR